MPGGVDGIAQSSHERTQPPRARALLRRRRSLRRLLLALASRLPRTPTSAKRSSSAAPTNESLSGFSQKAYKQALKELSADTEEYTRLRHADPPGPAGGGRRHGGAGGGGASGAAAGVGRRRPRPSSGRSSTRSSAGSAPVRVGDQVVDPGVVHANVASAFSSLPTPLLALLALLLACLLVIVASVLRNRVRDDRPG